MARLARAGWSAGVHRRLRPSPKRSPADAARLLSLYTITGRKVVIGMGKAGKITRVAAPFLAGEFTFASSVEGEATAEGQLSYKEMKKIIKKIQKNS